MFTAEMARANVAKSSASIEAIIRLVERTAEKRSKAGKYDATITFTQLTLNNEEYGRIRDELAIVRGYLCDIILIQEIGFIIKVNWKHTRFGERR